MECQKQKVGGLSRKMEKRRIDERNKKRAEAHELLQPPTLACANTWGTSAGACSVLPTPLANIRHLFG